MPTIFDTAALTEESLEKAIEEIAAERKRLAAEKEYSSLMRGIVPLGTPLELIPPRKGYKIVVRAETVDGWLHFEYVPEYSQPVYLTKGLCE